MKKNNLIISVLTLFFIFFYNISYSQNNLNLNGFYLESENGIEYQKFDDSNFSCKIDTNKVIGLENIISVKKQKAKYLHRKNLLITFDNDASKVLADISEKNIGKKFAFFYDNKLIMAPVIQSKITGGKVMITAGDDNTINSIYKVLKSDIKSRKKQK